MNRIVQFMNGLLLGALVGVALVLLLTPQSGEETRQMIRDRVETIRAEGERAAEAKRLELKAQFEELKQP
ncbi:MAG: YtxH domain-containing protein [Anaerolineae bacterium]|jgi:gas vesicle protein